ncbi:conjugative transfer protein MobI(A/C) [Acidithiobacillus thiooxidans]|uniref:Uncharacterized protein n=1 Tax=Acidithiobacillus thiooxidans ATCC 19377 TaxID=637390 RepID=A0A5P9XQ39_ACITH|nr:conjugative transfer protein MobI(A/C) [Acidithiobacillus thiooxidans]QFX96177.1 hypothetical protein GCD22_01904 [Acidithiobacillus thiooxidans ATCC 19377]
MTPPISLNFSPESLKDIEALLRRQMLFYAQAQDQILAEAKKLAGEFYIFQKQLSHQIRMDNENREWSDLSISVRKLRGYVTIQWRIRYWYKSSRDGRKGFNAKHLSKSKNSSHYKKSLAKEASAAEFQTVMQLEDQFIVLRHLSGVVRDAQKQLVDTMKSLGIDYSANSVLSADQESAYALHERIGNLLLLLHYRLWPQHNAADTQAGFVPLIDPKAGVSRNVDPTALHAALSRMEQSYAELEQLFMGKSQSAAGSN